MSRTKFLRGSCTHCGGPMEYPAEMIGSTAPCPHCGQTTELLLATPPQESAVPRSLILWTVVGLLILVLGLVSSLAALKWAQHRAAQAKPAASHTPATP